MNLLDSRLTIYFERLFIPIFENQEFIIDLKYEDDHYRFKYPMEVPHIMPIKEPYTREKNVIYMVVMIRVGKKYRKIAKAEINLYKKYFLTEKLGIDKWVHLELLQTQLEQMGHNTNILKTVINTGKIYMKSQLIDPALADTSSIGKISLLDNVSVYTSTTHASAISQILKNSLKNVPVIKDKTANTRTERYRSITEHTNEFLKNLKNRKNYNENELFEDIIEEDEEDKKEEFNDNLSDISISLIEGKEEKHEEINLLNLEIDYLIERVKKEFEERFDSLVPTDPKEMKFFMQNISNFILAIASNYSENLKALTTITKKLRVDAKDYYEKYKTLKKDFFKRRRELKAKTEEYNEKSKINIEENEFTQKNINEFGAECRLFKEKFKIETNEEKEDINNMAEILDSLVQDVNIFEGLEDKDALLVSDALNTFLRETRSTRPEEENDSEDINLLVDKIKITVNDLFEKKKINLMEIKYLENQIFSFGQCCVFLNVKDENIYVVNEKEYKPFSDWLIENFAYFEKENDEIKVVLTTQANKETQKSPSKRETGQVRMNTVNTPKMKMSNFTSFNDKKKEEKKVNSKNNKSIKTSKTIAEKK